MPCGLYMVSDHELLNTKDCEGNELASLNSGPDSFTLEEITNMDHRDFQPYDDRTEKRTLALIRLAMSKVEIVQTGVKGDWSDGDPPIGLYPIKQNLEGS
jgi:hypothetical protein